MIPGKRYSPEDMLRLAWRRRWFILIPFMLVSTATVLVASRLPAFYRSETIIQVVPQRVPESYVRSTITTRIEDRLKSTSQEILSRTRLERIIQDFNLYVDLRRNNVMEDIVQRMRSNIEVEVIRGADSFRVSYEADDPTVAMKVTERLASLFIEENQRDREVLAASTSAFLESQLSDARRRLMDQETKLEQYRLRYAGELPSQLQGNLQATQSGQMKLQSLVDSISRDQDRRLMLERMVADLSIDLTPVVPPQNPDRDHTEVASDQNVPPAAQSDPSGPAPAQLEAARTALKNLELRLKPEHPDVVRMRRMVENLEKRVESEATVTPPAREPQAPAPALTPTEATKRNRIRELTAEMESLDRQISYKDAEASRLHGIIETYEKRVEAVPARESELTALTRDYDTLQAVYRGLLSKREDSKLSENLERRQAGEQFKIIDIARRPERPFRPDRSRISLMGAAAGLVFGLGLVVLLEYRDRTLRTEADVLSALSLPVLALIPPIMTRAERRRARLGRLAFSVAASAFTLLCGAILVLAVRRW